MDTITAIELKRRKFVGKYYNPNSGSNQRHYAIVLNRANSMLDNNDPKTINKIICLNFYYPDTIQSSTSIVKKQYTLND
ncbi:hypothetical protein BpHYR1_042437 [Brachionus plicatilis]|uniref:Uncharacterized protein n=1 Tax=Brachionus plicatilis TaxID=10195 RepID=A0A3M7QWS2_BRAPC|nr:hypothetical protein BpHYR1_042437 [Brachionus plicatilis]